MRPLYDQTSAAVKEPPLTIEDTAASKVSTKCLPTEPTVLKVDVGTFHTAEATSCTTVLVVKTKVLSPLTKSTPTVPHFILAGQVPGVLEPL